MGVAPGDVLPSDFKLCLATMIYSPSKIDRAARGQACATIAAKVFINELAANERSYVLDLGCLCDTNIEFFLGRGCRVFVDDILRLNVRISKGPEANIDIWADNLLDSLDYPPNFFDGILCWNLFDYLDAEGSKRISHKLWTLLKISGCALALFRPEGAGTMDDVLRYRILSPAELFYEVLPFPPLKGKPHQNRDIGGLVAPLSLGNSYRLKNGWREVVLRK